MDITPAALARRNKPTAARSPTYNGTGGDAEFMGRSHSHEYGNASIALLANLLRVSAVCDVARHRAAPKPCVRWRYQPAAKPE
jgi:hypothetical protein